MVCRGKKNHVLVSFTNGWFTGVNKLVSTGPSQVLSKQVQKVPLAGLLSQGHFASSAGRVCEIISCRNVRYFCKIISKLK